METSQSTARTIRFSKSGQPKVEQFSTTPIPTATPNLSPNSNNPVTSNPATANAPIATNIQSNDGIFFQNKGCKRKNEVLRCEFIVTDREQNRLLNIYGRYSSPVSRIIDNQGTQYAPDIVNFGNKENNYDVEESLAKNIGLKGVLTFNNVKVQANKLALFEIAASTKGKDKFTIQFRDVTILN